MLHEAGMIDVWVNVVLPVVNGSPNISVRPLSFSDVNVVRMGAEVVYYGRPNRI